MEERTLNEKRNTVFLALLSAALHGETAELPGAVDWPAVFSLAGDQHVFPMILDAAYRSKAVVPPELLSYAQSVSMRIIMQQTLRTQRFLKLYKCFSERGLYPLVLKGLICRSLYPEPDQRPSGDEDMLIEPKDLKASHDVLTTFGLACESEEIDSSMHEITYVSPQLRIELHLSLFPKESRAYGDCNSLFDSIIERAVSQDIDGVSVHTLAPNDHLLYLICHAYKHFLHSGVGIRQVCDIAMFAEKHDSEIDWIRIVESCRKIRIESFTAALFQITAKHLDFSMPDAFAEVCTDESALLEDILSGGIYGATEENRQHSSTITLDAVEAQKQGRRHAGAFASVFRPLDAMTAQYPYLKKYPVLLPVAWTQRLARYLFRRDKRGSVDPAESVRIGKERVELLRQYGIIE